MVNRKICYSLLVLTGLWSCSETVNTNSSNLSAYVVQIENERIQKNKELLTEGVIEDEDIEKFKGLQYFPVDSNFRVKAKIEFLDNSKVLFTTSKSDIREYYKFCKLHFKIGDSSVALIGYAFDSTGKTTDLFIPFKDATTGKSTYGAGRYIEMHYKGEKDSLNIDFNYAFNPYCHYNNRYSCPLVPMDNILKVAINAGEKKFHD